jgi:hypothetical protein
VCAAASGSWMVGMLGVGTKLCVVDIVYRLNTVSNEDTWLNKPATFSKRKYTRVFVQSSELCPPPPPPSASVALPLGSKWGDTLACGEGVGEPNSGNWRVRHSGTLPKSQIHLFLLVKVDRKTAAQEFHASFLLCHDKITDVHSYNATPIF